MRELTASEASRNFSSVLDAAEHGETIVVTRGGHRVAMIAPAPRGNGRALLELAANWRGNSVFDEAFEANVEAARAAVSSEADNDPWQD
ncbi:MAG TPA: type II toxin-antitoxin system prevent-host-death family antitoxin [Pseudonocardiaceae bacterium]|jgi:prevent-host-death family protein